MAGQIADAQRALEPITIDSPQLQSDRNAVSDAIHAGATSLLSSRDELERSGAVDSTAGLESAGSQVDSLLSELRSSR